VEQSGHPTTELSSELMLDAADLGFLTSVYFLTFAAVQLPVGVWLDRYRPVTAEGRVVDSKKFIMER
jgi:MFS family permease